MKKIKIIMVAIIAALVLTVGYFMPKIQLKANETGVYTTDQILARSQDDFGTYFERKELGGKHYYFFNAGASVLSNTGLIGYYQDSDIPANQIQVFEFSPAIKVEYHPDSYEPEYQYGWSSKVEISKIEWRFDESKSLLQYKFDDGTYWYTSTDDDAKSFGLRIETIADDIKPIISGETLVISPLSNLISEADIRAGLTAYDATDGDVTSSITVISDDYTGKTITELEDAVRENNLKWADFHLKYQAKDKSNNATELIVTVRVVDDVAPTWIFSSNDNVIDGVMNIYTKYYYLKEALEQMNDNEEFKQVMVMSFLFGSMESTVTPNDNVTYSFNLEWLEKSQFKIEFLEHEILNNDSAASIEEKSNYIKSHYYNLQSVDLSFKIIDVAGNKSSVVPIQLNKFDDRPPVVSGQNEFNTLQGQEISLEFIKSKITAIDELEGNLEVVIESNGYIGKVNTPGTHNIVFSASDSSGNKTTYPVQVIVSDDTGPVFYGNKLFVTMSAANNWTIEEIIEHLISTGQLAETTLENYTIEANNYMAGKAGDYEVSLSLKDGVIGDFEESIILKIRTLQATTGEDPDPSDPGDEEPKEEIKAIEWLKENVQWILLGFGGFIVALFLLRAFGFGKRRRY